MTISSQSSKATYSGNGVTNVFPVSFPFQRNEDIFALLSAGGFETPLSQGTHYQLIGAGGASGGAISLSTAPATGQTLVLWRDPAIVQEVDYVENSAFPAETHESALDLLTMICQALRERLDRAVLYPVSTPASQIKDSRAFLEACETARALAQQLAEQADSAALLAQTHSALAAQQALAAQKAVGGLRVSSTDVAPANLSVKLAAGDGLAETLLKPGGDETLLLSLALAPDSGLETPGGYLRILATQGGGLRCTAAGVSVDTGKEPAQFSNNETLRPAMVAGRVINHILLGGM